MFLRYLAAGAVVFVIDVGLFASFVRLGFALWLGTSIAFTVAAVAHFILNKYLTFRAFDRTIVKQARTYLILQIPSLLLTAAIVEGCTIVLHFAPLVSKVISIAVNVPLGFLGHRYLTFGGGIRAMLNRLTCRSPQ
jgi:putative flippase GtrA